MDNIAGFDVLIYFFGQIETLMLIFVRVIGFMMFAPVLSGQNMWTMGRLFVSFYVAIALFMSGAVGAIYYIDTTPGYVFLLITEFLVGMVISYVTFLVFNSVLFSGQLIDFQMGFMMVNIMDPLTQRQVPVTGNVLYVGMSAILIATGGLHAMFMTFFYSYRVLPIGVANLVGNQELVWYILVLMMQSIVVGVRIAMPIIASMMLVNVALGVMVKTVPQMNVFVVGMPLKIFLGLILLWLVVTPNMDFIFWELFEMAHVAMMEVTWGMQP